MHLENADSQDTNRVRCAAVFGMMQATFDRLQPETSGNASHAFLAGSQSEMPESA